MSLSTSKTFIKGSQRDQFMYYRDNGIRTYHDLRTATVQLKNVHIVPVVVGALGSDTRKLVDQVTKLKMQTHLLQKTTLLGRTRVLQKVMDMDKKRRNPWDPSSLSDYINFKREWSKSSQRIYKDKLNKRFNK